SKFLDNLKVKWNEDKDEFLSKLPPQVREVLENEKFLMGVMGAIALGAGFYMNYLPYQATQELKTQLNKVQGETKTLMAKEKSLTKLFTENSEKSKSDVENYEMIKKQLFAVEFKDPLEVVEYAQGPLNSLGMDLNSVGQIEIIAEKLDGTENQKIDNTSNGTIASDENTLPKVEVSYNITSDYDSIAEFFTELETGEAFVQFRNNPIELALKGDVVAANFKLSGYADKLTLGETSAKEALETDDRSLKNQFFNKATNQGLRRDITKAVVSQLRGRYHGVLHFKDGRSLAFTNGKSFKLANLDREKEKWYMPSIKENQDSYQISFKERETGEIIDYKVKKNTK
ncbi:MAG: hypothetical protein ACRC5B_02960, partial [Fusobacteriaceae bacterium]